VFLRDRPSAFAVSDADGRFVLSGLPAGARKILYAIHADHGRAQSPFFGIEPGTVAAGHVLRFTGGGGENTGVEPQSTFVHESEDARRRTPRGRLTISFPAVDPSHSAGLVFLLDEQSRLHVRPVAERLAPPEYTTSFADVAPGSYRVGALFDSAGDLLYGAPLATRVYIRPDTPAAATVDLQPMLYANFIILNAAHEPLTDFQLTVRTSDGAPCPALSRAGHRVALVVVPGPLHVTVTRSGDVCFDEMIGIEPSLGELGFTTEIVCSE
jgi:hypothetical protein